MSKTIIDVIKFVNTAINDKSPVGEMTHILIENGHVRGTNGMLSIGSPIELDLTCAPHAATLLRAIRSCKEVVSLSITPGGRLSVKSGKFRALVPCIDPLECTYHSKPSGSVVNLYGAVLFKAFEKLKDFVSTDGTRPWSTGVLLRGQSAFATNNICMIESWLGIDIPFIVNVPLDAVKAVIDRKVPPARILMDERSMTFFYDSGAWIKTQLIEDQWPPVERVLDQESSPCPVPAGFFEGLASISKFSEEGRVYFRDGRMCTSQHDSEGAAYDVENLAEEGLYNIASLQLLDGVATSVDFDRYPNHALFFGDKVRGAVLAMRA